MPYRVNADLPIPVQRHLPVDAQTIYREAFNHAWSTYEGENRREEIAHRVAWAAIKKRYRKSADMWILKSDFVLQH